MFVRMRVSSPFLLANARPGPLLPVTLCPSRGAPALAKRVERAKYGGLGAALQEDAPRPKKFGGHAV